MDKINNYKIEYLSSYDVNFIDEIAVIDDITKEWSCTASLVNRWLV